MFANLDSLIEGTNDSILNFKYLVAIYNWPDSLERKDSLYARISRFHHLRDLIVVQYHEQQIIDIQPVDSANAIIIPNELPEQNRMSMKAYYLEYLENGREVILQNYNTILSIASQCPYAGGEAVYQARAFISLINDSQEYNDVGVCLQNGIFRTPIKEEDVIETKIQIQPNPANDRVNIISSNNLFTRIEILDLMGRKVSTFELNNEISRMDIAVGSYSPGSYYLEIVLSDNSVVIKKLIIAR